MPDRPYTLLSCGVSLDGYLDSAGDERLILSNEADLDRVDGVRAGPAGRVEDGVDAQVRLGRGVPRQPYRLVGVGDERRVGVRVGVHGDGGHAEGAAGGEDPPGDLPPVGHQKLIDHAR